MHPVRKGKGVREMPRRLLGKRSYGGEYDLLAATRVIYDLAKTPPPPAPLAPYLAPR
jgi:hypothetical protein